MCARSVIGKALFPMAIWAIASLIRPCPAYGHCDTLDGPVVASAKLALEKGDVTPALKWVRPESEKEIRATFDKTLSVRKLGTEARELADMHFFETLVRIHRMGEGAPYTGLQPAGTDPGKAVRTADKALETGTADEVLKLISDLIAAGIRERFAQAIEKRKLAEQSVEKGRDYVAAYVEFVHFVEAAYQTASGHVGEGHTGDARDVEDSKHHEHEVEAQSEHRHP